MFWCVQGMSQILVTRFLDKLAKKLLAVRPEKVTRRKNRKKTRMAIAKAFCVKRKRNSLLENIANQDKISEEKLRKGKNKPAS